MIKDTLQVTQVNNENIIWLNLVKSYDLLVNSPSMPVTAVEGFTDTVKFFMLEMVDLGQTGHNCTKGLVLQNGKKIVFNWNLECYRIKNVDVRNLYSCLYINLAYTYVSDFDFNATPNLALAVI